MEMNFFISDTFGLLAIVLRHCCPWCSAKKINKLASKNVLPIVDNYCQKRSFFQMSQIFLTIFFLTFFELDFFSAAAKKKTFFKSKISKAVFGENT
jgi:hypothetical protein